eukprot:3419761-Pleurochrysis_carterae.AAC.1
MPDVELVVEVGGGLAERSGDAAVELKPSLHEPLADLLHLLRELGQVAHQKGGVDVVETLTRGEVDRKSVEAALEARVDDEGAGGRVHRRKVLGVEQHLLRELAQIVNVAIVNVLAHERDVGGGVVRVEHCHVQVVDKVDELLVAGRAVVLASLLLERRLQDLLVHVGVSVVVDVDHLGGEVLVERAQLAHDDGGFAAAGAADEHGAMLVGKQ